MASTVLNDNTWLDDIMDVIEEDHAVLNDNTWLNDIMDVSEEDRLKSLRGIQVDHHQYFAYYNRVYTRWAINNAPLLLLQ